MKLLSILAFGTYIFLLCLFPVKLYRCGVLPIFSEIFPAIEIFIVYCFFRYRTVGYVIAFIVGMLIDQIGKMPLGSSSLAFIIANIGLEYVAKWVNARDEMTDLLLFCAYSLCIICFRCFIFIIEHGAVIEGMSIYFYYLTTILSYPLLRFMVHGPRAVLNKNF